jgi:hypothetical protein
MKPPLSAELVLSNFPVELREVLPWLLWKNETRKGKPTKVPYTIGGNMASTTDPRTWCDFRSALAGHEDYDGIGIVIGPPYVGIDLDHCRNPESGVIQPWAMRIIKDLNSYTEISPSGTGAHIWVIGELPGNRRRKGPIEMYQGGRYFTVTGKHLEGTPLTVERRDLSSLYQRMLQGGLDPEAVAKNSKKPPSKTDPEAGKLERLMTGDWAGLYGSQSEADLGLCILLARKTTDPNEIDAEFRKSGLMRPKWDSPRGDSTYGRDTIITAIRIISEPTTTDWRALLIYTRSGQPRAILANAITALRHSPDWEGVLGYNEFSLYAVTLQPTPWQGPGNANWTDADDSLATEWLQRSGINVKSNVTAEAVQTVAREHSFHPVRDYLQALKSDGKERVYTWLIAYLGCPDTPWTRAVGRRWLISAVARIMQPGCQADYCLLLEGIQGLKKSSALSALAGDDWFTDNISDLGSKDSRLDLRGKWIIEWAELANMRRHEAEKVKAFLTARIDHFRAPYGRRTEDMPRSCVFAGTTNDETPFIDSTGNRRFWPVRCGEIDIEALRRDRDQLWAEAYILYKNGEPWWLESAELNKLAVAEQEERYEPGVWDSQIREWIENPTRREDLPLTGENSKIPVPVSPWEGSELGKVSVTDVLVHAVGKDIDRCNQSDRNQVVRCLRHFGWTQWRDWSRGTDRGRRYYVSPEWKERH